MAETEMQWLKTENRRLTEQNETLLRELHVANKAKTYYMRIAEKATAQHKELLTELHTQTGSVGERGEACVAIDGGNL